LPTIAIALIDSSWTAPKVIGTASEQTKKLKAMKGGPTGYNVAPSN